MSGRVLAKVVPGVAWVFGCLGMAFYEVKPEVLNHEFVAASVVVFVMTLNRLVDAVPPFGGSDDG